MEIIDVTLRESIHTNKYITYNKSLKYISKISKNLKDISYVEIGYLDKDVNGKDLGKYNKEYFENAFKILNGNLKISVMMHIKEFYPQDWDIDIIKHLDMIRVLIDENCDNLEEIVAYFHKYDVKVSANCSYISKKNKEQFNNIIDSIIKAKVDIIYLADTNGSMIEKDLLDCIEIIKSKDRNIKIGIHTHNHMQLALANAFNLRENIDYIDGSINGFGKGAGNVKIETLILMLERVKNIFKDDKELYKLYISGKYFYEEVIEDYSNKYIEDFANLIYAYKNLKLKQINEYQSINIEYRVPEILNIKNYKLNEIIEFAKSKVPYYKNYDYDFYNMPILDKIKYRENVPPYSIELLSGEIKSSFVFSTSGTTGNPQFVVRDVNDIDYQINDYVGLNIGENDVVLNLFWAGIWGIYTTANLYKIYY